MTKDDIIKLAETQLHRWWLGDEKLEAFYNLAAAAEREACETAVEDIARKYQKAHEASLENIADECAAAIRARSGE